MKKSFQDDDELPFRDQLFKTAVRLTKSREDAEDLLQDTYLKAFRHWQSFQEGTNLKAWLFKILKNTFINLYRKRKHQPPQTELSELEESLEGHLLEGPAKSPEDELLERSWDDEVLKAFSNLPHNFKVVVLLADLEGYSYREIAEILAIPVGTVMSRLYRGRKALEQALLHYGQRWHYLRALPQRLRSQDLRSPASPGPQGRRGAKVPLD
ncbi:MAG: sigma-70 family RNA polymerase sigma factor [Thermoanaerobaculaceae bacterium]